MIKCPKCGIEYDGAERFCPKDGTRLLSNDGKPSRIPSIAPDSDPLINTVIQGRYKVLEQIGEGGMGVVYVAEHVEIEKKVALKVLRDDFSKRPEVVARFRQEAKSASRIGNAHIVDVTDFGELENGGVFFVMEHLKGKGLSDVIRNEVITEERAVRIVFQIAKALRAAHKLGIVHRDLKPENIFLVEDDDQRDFVKILDFGIAKISDRDSEGQRLTKTGMIFGTPEYMSPEQAAGKPLDHRVDIYALGCIMFEMFTGDVPYEGETFMAVLTQHMFEPIPAIEAVNPETDVRESVKEVVYKAMAKDKEDRYPDMEALAKDLERAIEGSLAIPLGEMNTAEFARIGNDKTTTTGTRWTPGSGNIASPGGKRGAILIGVGLVVLLGFGGGVAYYKGYIPGMKEVEANADEKKDSDVGGKQDAIAKEKTKEKAEKEIQELSTEQVAAEKTEDEKKDTGKTTLEVLVKTDPPGATVFLEGMGQVCSSSPCEISMEEGEPKRIEAKKDGKHVQIMFTPSLQNKEIELEFPKREKKERRKNKTKTGNKRPVQQGGGGLKIPDIFKNN